MQPALSSKGAIPKTNNNITSPFGDTSSGLFGSISKGLGFPSSTPISTSNPTSSSPRVGVSSQSALGTNSGLLKQSSPDTTYTHITTTNQNGATTSKPTPNPSVLAQQQSLNKQGAGLVEDGIAGPLTQAAIEKYANKGTTPSSTTPDIQTPKEPEVTPPAPLTTAGQAPGVLSTGKPTDYEKTTIGGLINQSQTESPQVAKARQDLADFEKNLAETNKNISAQGISLDSSRGQEANIGQAATAEHLALQNAVTNALSSQSQQITAGTAANTGAQTQASRATGAAQNVLGAVAPQFPSYSSQTVQPGLIGNETGGTSGTLDNAISNVTQLLASGKIGYSDAQSQLSGYGQKGLDALSQWATGNNFNIAQSNTLAGQQGSIGVNYQLADTALKNVESKLQDLMSLQKTNIPLVNSATNWISTTFGKGSEQTRAMTGAVQSLRNAYGSLLASVKGGTPTDYSSQAAAEIPNEPTPNDIKAIRDNFEVLGKARANILGNPGQSGVTSGSTTGGGLYDF